MSRKAECAPHLLGKLQIVAKKLEQQWPPLSGAEQGLEGLSLSFRSNIGEEHNCLLMQPFSKMQQASLGIVLQIATRQVSHA